MKATWKGTETQEEKRVREESETRERALRASSAKEMIEKYGLKPPAVAAATIDNTFESALAGSGSLEVEEHDWVKIAEAIKPKYIAFRRTSNDFSIYYFHPDQHFLVITTHDVFSTGEAGKLLERGKEIPKYKCPENFIDVDLVYELDW